MIRDIRDYFDAQVKKVDANILEWKKDLFNNNDVSIPQSDKYYNLAITTSNYTPNGNAFEDAFDATLSIWAKTKRDRQTSFDDTYDKALSIRNCIISPIDLNASAVGFIDILPISIEPIEEIDNDNTIRFDMTFTIRIESKF